MGLSTEQFTDIMRGYDQTRQRNHALHIKRLDEIYTVIPKIKEIDQLMAQHSIAIGKSLLMNMDPALLEELKAQNLALSMEKAELLALHGYSPDYLDPIHTCPACKDTGYVGNEKCTCLKQAIVEQAYQQSKIWERLQEENFNSFSYDYYSNLPKYPNRPTPRQNIIAVVEKCMHFIQTFSTNPGQNILFQGNVGVGKTFLTNCIAKEILDEAHTVIYLTAFQLVEILEQHRFHKSDSLLPYTLDYVLSCDLLIIDDLGTEFTNAFVVSQFFHCINERLIGKKSTIISTNLSLRELQERYSERIMSRIAENYLICNIYADDIRLKKSFSN